MADGKVVILDGTNSGDDHLAPILAVLTAEVGRSGAEVQIFKLRDNRLAHCIGCYGCWIETPGVCREADAGRVIAQAIIQSETTILFTPVTCGGYSSELKRMMDRWIPLSLPYFRRYHGEIHHVPRYPLFPRLIAVGVQHRPDADEANVFRLLVGRNAINFHSDSHAAEVVVETDDSVTLRHRFHSVLERGDPLPSNDVLTSFMPTADTSVVDVASNGGRRALLIIGSPKTKRPSTSSVLGGFLLERLKQRGWATESSTLDGALRQISGQAALRASVDRADLLLFAFPLYIDALPFLMTKALEVIAAHRRAMPAPRAQRLAVVSNCGFPEAHQNTVAVAICHQFAVQCGMTWAGALTMGAGEALSSGQSLTAADRSGRPPVTHVIEALTLTAAALAEGRSVPTEAATMMARSPIPFVPFAVWQWMFRKMGGRGWVSQAAKHGVTKKDLLNRPHANLMDRTKKSK